MNAADIAAAVRAGERCALEVVSEALERLRSRPELNAVITICEETALARARSIAGGRLAGVPLLVKDLINTAGIRTTYASRIYADHVPLSSSPAVTALEAEGAVVVGKANADEFAWGVTGQNEHYGDMVNPSRPERIAGGSSGGNAAALAADLVPLALGTDTGGSIRMPAGACGVVGCKPALGEVSVEGVFPLAPSFDTVGPMARSVGDCALAHAVLTGVEVPRPRLHGVRVGVLGAPPDLTGAGVSSELDPRAQEVASRLRDAGATVTEVTLPVPPDDTWPVFYGEAAAAHADTFPARASEYGRVVREKLEVAQTVAPADIQRARRSIADWRNATTRLPQVDVIASPTLGMAELPPVGVDELEVRLAFSAYTRPFSNLGWAAVAIGELQLAARDTATALAAALAVEAAAA